MKRIVISLALVVLTAGAVSGQKPTAEVMRHRTLEKFVTGQPLEIDLWPEGMPNSNSVDYKNLPTDSWDLAPRMQVWLPEKGDTPSKAVVICPGGGYVTLALDHEGTLWNKFFCRENLAAIVLTYRLPHGHSEVPASDVYQAIRIVKTHAQEWHIDPSKIGVMGFSAGGHLASTVATHATGDVRPAFQILFYPVITMNPAYTHAYSRKMLIGDNPSQEQEMLYSNEKQVDENTPRAFIILADDDPDVPPMNSALYYTALKEHKIPVTMHVYPSGGHGFGMSLAWEYHAQMMTELADWLKRF